MLRAVMKPGKRHALNLPPGRHQPIHLKHQQPAPGAVACRPHDGVTACAALYMCVHPRPPFVFLVTFSLGDGGALAHCTCSDVSMSESALAATLCSKLAVSISLNVFRLSVCSCTRAGAHGTMIARDERSAVHRAKLCSGRQPVGAGFAGSEEEAAATAALAAAVVIIVVISGVLRSCTHANLSTHFPSESGLTATKARR